MKYIVATSNNLYYNWQILVQINNFIELGIDDKLTYIISSDKKDDFYKEIEKSCNVKIKTYKDSRNSKLYTSSIRPHIMAKYMRNNTEKVFLYLDPDVIFRELLSFDDKQLNDNIWYLSDTKSYIGIDYIKGKSEELLHKMGQVAEISPMYLRKNDNEAGGAQYLVKGTDDKFWSRVEKVSEDLYKLMTETSHIYSPEHPIQAWTADMWALLWTAWFYGYKSKIIDELDFSWATDTINIYNKRKIFHNAGATSNNKNIFNKTIYHNKHPFNENFDSVNESSASYQYIKEINKTKERFGNLINKYL